MLHTEAALSVIGVALFALAVVGVRRRVALAA
jgi:hypothetical protein